MALPYSTVDALGLFLASVIPQVGRNEVQFYPLRGSASEIIDASKICRHEFLGDAEITAVTWLNEFTPSAAAGLKTLKKRSAHAVAGSEPEQSPKGSPKPAKNGKSADTNGSAEPPQPLQELLLAVALSLGEIWVFAPTNGTPVSKVSVPEQITLLTPAHANNHVWALGASATIYEIAVFGGDVVKTVRFGRLLDPETCIVSRCLYRQSKKKLGAEPEPLFAASQRLYLLDGAKHKNHVIAELPDPELQLKVAQILSTGLDGVHVITRRENLNVLAMYDVSDAAQNPAVFECLGSDLLSVRVLSPEYAVALTSKGAEFFSLKSTKGKPASRTGPVATAHADHAKVQFENVYWSETHGVVGVWYDASQARFTQIFANTKSASAGLKIEGSHEIAVDYKEAYDSELDDTARDTPDITFNGVADISIENVSATTLYAQLSELLLADPVSPEAVARLCASNDDEANIKETVRQFSRADQDQYETLVETLFAIVSVRVAQDPSRKSSLSLWLQWLLLVHGGHIQTQKKFAEILKKLQKSLDDGMSLMAKLLALQGRLQLLKAQAELRHSVASGEFGLAETEEYDAQEQELDALNDTFNNTTNMEESVIYANGEGDDFEEAVVPQVRGREDEEVVYGNGEADSGDEDEDEEGEDEDMMEEDGAEDA